MRLAIVIWLLLPPVLGYPQVHTQVQTSELELSLDPEHRWDNVIQSMGQEKVTRVRLIFDDVISQLLEGLGQPERFIARQLIDVGLSDVAQYMPYPWSAEAVGISRGTGIPAGQLVFLNRYYELVATGSRGQHMCTSIVAEMANGTVILGRNLDFRQFTGDLRDLILNVDFKREGRLLFHSTHFFGMTGVTTGSAPGRFAITLNERNNGSLAANVWHALTGGETTFHVIRRVLETADSYGTAVQMLTAAHTIAPEYFAVAGPAPGQGCVITGDRDRTLDVYPLDVSAGRWFVAQTNFDRWAPDGDGRRTDAERAMTHIGRDRVDMEGLLSVLQTYPVLNPGTVYTTLMSVQPDFFWAKAQHYRPAGYRRHMLQLTRTLKHKPWKYNKTHEYLRVL